jgi:hypothetical protein
MQGGSQLGRRWRRGHGDVHRGAVSAALCVARGPLESGGGRGAVCAAPSCRRNPPSPPPPASPTHLRRLEVQLADAVPLVVVLAARQVTPAARHLAHQQVLCRTAPIRSAGSGPAAVAPGIRPGAAAEGSAAVLAAPVAAFSLAVRVLCCPAGPLARPAPAAGPAQQRGSCCSGSRCALPVTDGCRQGPPNDGRHVGSLGLQQQRLCCLRDGHLLLVMVQILMVEPPAAELPVGNGVAAADPALLLWGCQA